MLRALAYPGLVLALTGGLAACAEATTRAGTLPIYLGSETLLMAPDLVNVRVRVRDVQGGEQVTRYADCAAARFALENGYGFARQVRTNLTEEGGVWRADAVYSITSALPRGLRTMDAEVVAQDCAAEKIPMV